jgi:hypothetical protein
MLSHNAQCRILLIILLNVIMMSVVLLNVVMLNVVMLNVIMLNVVMLNVVLLNVVMLSVVAPLLISTPNMRLRSKFMQVKNNSSLRLKYVATTKEQKHTSLLLKYAVNKLERFITND